MPSSLSAPSPRVTWAPVIVLTLVNVFNYVDRSIISALLPEIQSELGLADKLAGLLATAFIIVYALTSPIFGWLGDRGVRKNWVALGVGLWSLATGLAGLARNFGSLFAARAAIGVGEASYGTLSPSLLADYVPRPRRGAVMAVFFAAIPVGTAMGYILGGVLGEALGWRRAFFMVGFPGLLLAAATLLFKEPTRGVHDEAMGEAKVPLLAAYKELLGNRLYVWTVAGYVAYTFAIGALAWWMPSYFMRERGFPPGSGMWLFGGITVVTGLVGTIVGGQLGDRWQARNPNGYVWLSVTAMTAGAALAFAAFLTPHQGAFLTLLGLSELFLFLNTGPVNALIVNSVRPAVRATAAGASIFAIHVLGDAISPFIIGAVADASGLHDAVLLLPAVFFLAGLLWLGSVQRAKAAR